MAGRYDKRHAGDKPTDNRIGAQRDADRLLYSSAFRRLGGITQVVAATEGHVFHNRLTHTLKVAQVARRLAEMLVRNAPDPEEFTRNILDPEVVTGAAMAHDLGHPPFGHVAEKRLRRLVAEVDPDNGFEGNAQSFRIVTRLARCDIAFPGLNLTRATLNAILKYPRFHNPNDEDAPGYRKWGAYRTESEDFWFARGLENVDQAEKGFDYNGPKSVEAAIMDWADDITYAVHDAEDMYRAGLAPLDRLAAVAKERERFAAWVQERWHRARREPVAPEELAKAIEIIPVSFGSDRPYDGTDSQRIALRSFTSSLIGRYVAATSLEEQQSDWRLRIEPWARLEVDALKELTWHYVIERPALASQQEGQLRIIDDLFEILLDAASGSRNQALLPERVRHQLELAVGATADVPSLRGRIVCDAICSFTEDEAMQLHRRLTGIDLGSVIDVIV